MSKHYNGVDGLKINLINYKYRKMLSSMRTHIEWSRKNHLTNV